MSVSPLFQKLSLHFQRPEELGPICNDHSDRHLSLRQSLEIYPDHVKQPPKRGRLCVERNRRRPRRRK